MKVVITKNYDDMSRKAAAFLASQMIVKPDSVIGLATGGTPEGTYTELVEFYKRGYLDFSEITTFNLDEYYGLPKESTESYDYFMWDKLFNHVNIDPAKVHIPTGTAVDVGGECLKYEKMIQEAGGVDLQLLGIGTNAHVGFNEPGDEFPKNTHLVKLQQATIKANARYFDSIDQVPTEAISMGIGTIMRSKRIILIASGEGKADAIYKTVKGPINPQNQASILQLHNDVTVIIDEAAASKL